ncbi:MAG: hypothetical protein OXF32_13250 [Anaerolineaceae bacterium]|nr:hypothetical protein [Anaerolineaceae bacterium]
MNRSPARNSGPRLALLLTGAAALVWLPLEDPSLWPPLSLGTAFASMLTLQIFVGHLYRRDVSAGRRMLLTAAGGTLAGACAAPIAVGLMLLKNVQHAHSIPDFPFAVLFSTLQLAPQMALGGALAGTVLGLSGHFFRENGKPAHEFGRRGK